MSDSWQASVVLVTSSDRDESHFGTGFVIDKDERTTYLLTCAHVVRDVGGLDKIGIYGIQARVIASSPEDGADLAVLRIEKPLDVSPLPLLPLYSVAEQDRPFSTAGFQLDGKQFLIRKLHGTLGEQVWVQVREQAGRIRAWDLEITDKYPLQPGYSGSPVVDKHDNVIGVVNTRRGEGKTGVAISIETLKIIWREIPPGLLMQRTIGTAENKTKSFSDERNLFGVLGGVSHVGNIELLLSFERVFDLCVESLKLIHKCKIEKEDRSQGTIDARAGMTWRTFGDRISFRVFKIDDSRTEVEVSSRPVVKSTLVDYGKNLENIERITSFLQEHGGKIDTYG